MEVNGKPIILDEKIVDEMVSNWEAALSAGKTEGTGKYWRGIQGDIENTFGWHRGQSPETTLTEQKRVAILKRLKIAAQSAESSKALITWIDERVTEISEREIDKLIADESLIPDEKKDQSKPIIAEILQLNRTFGQIGKSEDTHIDTHSLGAQGKSVFSESATQQAGDVWAQIAQKKADLYKLVFE